MKKAINKYIDKKIEFISIRLDKIESEKFSKKEKSIWELIASRAGLIALGLSIMLGSFTLYDRFVTKPQEKIIANQAGVRNTFDELSKIMLEINKAATVSPQIFNATASSLAAKRLALVEKAQKHVEEFPEVLNAADYVLLGSQLLIYDKIEKAISIADLLVAATDDPILQAHGDVLKAQAVGVIGPNQDLELARSLLNSAMTRLESVKSALSIEVQMSVLSNQLGLELNDNKCQHAQEIIITTGTLLDKYKSPEFTRDQIAAEIQNMRITRNDSCELELSAIYN